MANASTQIVAKIIREADAYTIAQGLTVEIVTQVGHEGKLKPWV